MSTDSTPEQPNADTPVAESAAGSGWQWDRQKTMITVIVGLALLCVILLFRGGGSDDEQQTPGTTTPPSTTVPPTTTSPADTTLVEDLEYVAGHFPGLQLNSASTPYVCTVGVDAMSDEMNEDLQAGAKDEMARDGKKLKEVKIQQLTIVLSEEGDRFTGFIVRATGTLEDDTPLGLTDILVGDGTWNPERSAEFARNLREEVKNNHLFSLSGGSGGHRVRLNLHIPRNRPVNSD